MSPSHPPPSDEMELEAGVHIYPRPPSKRNPHVEVGAAVAIQWIIKLYVIFCRKL